MPLSRRSIQLIKDNENLSTIVIARFLKVKPKSVSYFRNAYGYKGKWFHKGCGFPFVMEYIASGSTKSFRVEFSNRVIYSGNIQGALTNLDRLIYCLENNNGKPPRTLNEVVFGDLEFINRREQQ